MCGWWWCGMEEMDGMEEMEGMEEMDGIECVGMNE